MHLKRITLRHEKYPTKEYYPFNLQIFQRSKSIELSSSITFFIGENGTGKSTLLRAIANKSRIHIWEAEQFRRMEHNPYERSLFHTIDIEWLDGQVTGSYFGSQIFNRFSLLLEEWASIDPGVMNYFGGQSLLTQSHGQSIISFFASRYKVKGLYLLDEPETALSPTSQLELVKILRRSLKENKAQFIIATHSPVLLATPGAQIFSFDTVPIGPIHYEETEYYKFFKDFMNNREKYF